MPLLDSPPVSGSNAVVTLKAFCWPGVGARKPVLAAARIDTPSPTTRRPETFAFVVLPKPSKSSMRSAVVTVHISSGSSNSTSP